jgi:putative transposase
VALEAPAVLNTTWAPDFIGDTLDDGRCYRTLNVLDESNREGLAIEIDTSLPSQRMTAVLDQPVAIHGTPGRLRCDNAPAFIAEKLAEWCEAHGAVLHHIQPGKPNQNAFIERFNRTYRTEVLNAWVFTWLPEVREITGGWLELYNTERPHRSLGRVPPRTYLPRPLAASDSLAMTCVLYEEACATTTSIDHPASLLGTIVAADSRGRFRGPSPHGEIALRDTQR